MRDELQREMDKYTSHASLLREDIACAEKNIENLKSKLFLVETSYEILKKSIDSYLDGFNTANLYENKDGEKV